MKQLFKLVNQDVRRRCWETIKAAPEGFVVRISPPTRNLEQNAKFHALCADIEKSRFHWAGKPRDAAAWKSLLISGHAVATGLGADVVPGIEGEFINIRESSAVMTGKRMSSLIEYSLAFMVMNGIRSENFKDADIRTSS